jgi:hypothetical protein
MRTTDLLPLAGLAALIAAGCGDDTSVTTGTGTGGAAAGVTTSGATAPSSTSSGGGAQPAGSGGNGAGAGDAGGGDAGGGDAGGGGGATGSCSQDGDGRWGPADDVIDIPAPAEEGAAIYLDDVQAAFPDADWATVDRLTIPAGHWRSLYLGNLPQRTREDPLVITNRDGQVRIGGLGANYNISIVGGAGWVLTGRYDPESGTGDAAAPGHRGCDYANSRGNYGIFVDGEFDGAPMGVAVGGRATAFELDMIEVTRVSFAGVMLKTDDTGDATMRDVDVHDLYIHDTDSEGFYIGSTQAQPQHTLENLRVWNNRVLRTGTEAFQAGQLGDGCEIHHNVFALAAIDWKDPFAQYQDGGVQLGFRHGTSSFHHNIVIGAAGTMMAFFPQPVDGDPHAEGDRVTVHDNLFSDGRNLAGYVFPQSDGVTAYSFERNDIRAFAHSYDEIDPEGTAPADLILTFNQESPIAFHDNRWDAEPGLINALPDDNGDNGNVTGSGNERASIAPVAFVDFMGWPEDTDPLLLEQWAATSEIPLGGAPVSYQPGDYVMDEGELYRSIADAPQSGLKPAEHPEAWEHLPLPVDDVRLAPGSPHAGLGLLDGG